MLIILYNKQKQIITQLPMKSRIKTFNPIKIQKRLVPKKEIEAAKFEPETNISLMNRQGSEQQNKQIRFHNTTPQKKQIKTEQAIKISQSPQNANKVYIFKTESAQLLALNKKISSEDIKRVQSPGMAKGTQIQLPKNQNNQQSELEATAQVLVLNKNINGRQALQSPRIKNQQISPSRIPAVSLKNGSDSLDIKLLEQKNREIKQLKEEISRNKSSIQELQTKHRDLFEEKQKLIREENNKIFEFQALQIKQLQQKLKSQETFSKQFKNSSCLRQEEVRKLQAQHKENKITIETLQKQNHYYCQQIENLKRQKNQACNDSSKKMSELFEKEKLIKKQLEEQKLKISYEKEEFVRQCNQERVNFEEELNRNLVELENTRKKISSYEKLYNNQKERYKRLQIVYFQQKNSNNFLSTRVSQYEQSIRGLQQKIQQKNQQIEALNYHFDDLVKSYNQAQQSSKISLDSLTKSLYLAQKQERQLKIQLSEKESEMLKNKNRISELQNKINSELQVQLLALQQQNKTLSIKINQDQIRYLDEMNQLKKQHSEKTNDLLRKINNYLLKIRCLENQKQSCVMEIEQVSQQNSQLKQRNKELKTVIENEEQKWKNFYQEGIKRLRQKVTNYKLQANNHTKLIETVQNQSKQLNKCYVSLLSKLNENKSQLQQDPLATTFQAFQFHKQKIFEQMDTLYSQNQNLIAKNIKLQFQNGNITRELEELRKHNEKQYNDDKVEETLQGGDRCDQETQYCQTKQLIEDKIPLKVSEQFGIQTDNIQIFDKKVEDETHSKNAETQEKKSQSKQNSGIQTQEQKVPTHDTQSQTSSIETVNNQTQYEPAISQKSSEQDLLLSEKDQIIDQGTIEILNPIELTVPQNEPSSIIESPQLERENDDCEEDSSLSDPLSSGSGSEQDIQLIYSDDRQYLRTQQNQTANDQNYEEILEQNEPELEFQKESSEQQQAGEDLNFQENNLLTIDYNNSSEHRSYEQQREKNQESQQNLKSRLKKSQQFNKSFMSSRDWHQELTEKQYIIDELSQCIQSYKELILELKDKITEQEQIEENYKQIFMMFGPEKYDHQQLLLCINEFINKTRMLLQGNGELEKRVEVLEKEKGDFAQKNKLIVKELAKCQQLLEEYEEKNEQLETNIEEEIQKRENLEAVLQKVYDNYEFVVDRLMKSELKILNERLMMEDQNAQQVVEKREEDLQQEKIRIQQNHSQQQNFPQSQHSQPQQTPYKSLPQQTNPFLIQQLSEDSPISIKNKISLQKQSEDEDADDEQINQSENKSEQNKAETINKEQQIPLQISDMGQQFSSGLNQQEKYEAQEHQYFIDCPIQSEGKLLNNENPLNSDQSDSNNEDQMEDNVGENIDEDEGCEEEDNSQNCEQDQYVEQDREVVIQEQQIQVQEREGQQKQYTEQEQLSEEFQVEQKEEEEQEKNRDYKQQTQQQTELQQLFDENCVQRDVYPEYTIKISEAASSDEEEADDES